MIKTLRITTIVAAILAVIFFAFVVVCGVRSDENMEELLNSPGVIEKFNKSAPDKAKTSQSSPLVQQATSFALYLNPPAPKTPKTATGGTTITPRGPAVTPQFKVKGTCYYKGRPELSLVLIDEPGKGLRWVRQSSKVGHLLIEQVKDGLVVVKDGSGTFELIAEQQPEPSLLEGASAVPLKRTGFPSQAELSGRAPVPTGSKSAVPFPTPWRTGPGVTDSKIKIPQAKDMSPEKDAKMNELIERLRQIQNSFKSDKTGSGTSAKEKAEMMEILISKFKSSRLSAEEAKKLSTLGKKLKKDMEEPNRSGPEENKDN